MTSPIKILFKGYQLLNKKEKKDFFKLIKEDQGSERMNKLYKGLEVEHMTEEEERILFMVKDLRKNAIYYKSK